MTYKVSATPSTMYIERMDLDHSIVAPLSLTLGVSHKVPCVIAVRKRADEIRMNPRGS
jgi:hypothetical protein